MIRLDLHRSWTPGALPPRGVFLFGCLAILTMFLFAWSAPGDIRLPLLYVFPLTAIAFHCEENLTTLAGFVLAVICQLSISWHHEVPIIPLALDAVVYVCAFMLVIVLARMSRAWYFEMTSLATTDPLTGLLNRRGFEAVAEREIARQKRYGSAFALVLIDLDDFKQVNDTRGHQAGDEALKVLAAILREFTRESDAIARLGGDEFVILMPLSNNAAALCPCHQLAAMIAAGMKEATFSLTASVGCRTFTEPPESTADALQMADKAMYAAKANGKARVVSL